MLPLVKKHIRVNSNSRLSGTTSDFSAEIKLPPAISGVVDHVSVVGCVVPKSYYLVREGFNSFNLIEGAQTVVITIPAGNYTLAVFKTTLQNILNATTPTGFTYTITYPTAATVNEGKFTYTVTNNFLQPAFSFLETSDICEQMGFSAESQYQFVGNTLKSANVVKFVSEDSLFLRSDIVDDSGSDTLLNIYTAGVPDFGTISYTNPDIYGTAKKIKANANGVYRFYLTDEDGHNIDLNGLNTVFTIVVFKRIDVFEKISAYITYRYETGKK